MAQVTSGSTWGKWKAADSAHTHIALKIFSKNVPKSWTVAQAGPASDIVDDGLGYWVDVAI